MVGSDAYLLCPDIVRLVILLVNADINSVSGHLKNLGAELPRPCGGLMLEIIAEREVSEHLKKSAVTRCDSDPLNIRRSDTFLTGGHTRSRRGELTCKILFERCHSRIYEQQALIALRNQ